MKEDIENKKEVGVIIENMKERIIQLCHKFETGNCNSATLPAFFLGVQGDIDDGLKQCKKITKEEQLCKCVQCGEENQNEK